MGFEVVFERSHTRAMEAFDIVVLLILIATTVWGARSGFAKQLATVASFVLGYIVAVNFRAQVAPMIDVAAPWNLYAAATGLFVGTSLVVWLAFSLVKSSIERAGLTGFDAQMGGLLGMAKGFALAGVVTIATVLGMGGVPRDAVLRSFSGYNLCRLVLQADAVVPAEWLDALEPHIQPNSTSPRLVENLRDVASDPLEYLSPSDQPTSHDDSFSVVFPADPSVTDSPSPAAPLEIYWRSEEQAQRAQPDRR